MSCHRFIRLQCSRKKYVPKSAFVRKSLHPVISVVVHRCGASAVDYRPPTAANASVDRLTIGRIDNRPDPEGTPTPPRSPHRQHFHRARVAFAGARRARHWREIFAETDARFLQRAGGARCAEGCLWEARVGRREILFDGRRTQRLRLCRRFEIGGDRHRVAGLADGGEVIRRTQSAARAVRRPLVLDQARRRDVIQHELDDAVGHRTAPTVLGTASAVSLRPESMDHEADLLPRSALGRIAVRAGLRAEVRRPGERQQVVAESRRRCRHLLFPGRRQGHGGCQGGHQEHRQYELTHRQNLIIPVSKLPAASPAGHSQSEVGQTIAFCRLSNGRDCARLDRPQKAMVCPTGSARRMQGWTAMIRSILVLLAVIPLCGQTAAGMLARLSGVSWEAPPTAACAPRIPIQMDVYATVEWTHHCADTRDGVIREDFFYVFGEPARIARLRVDMRPVDESPENTARLLPALERMLTARFGTPTHEPKMMEIGFYAPRYGQPVAGDHWKGGGLHYFVHANLSASQPMGIRRGVQLVVIADRLFAERAQDDLILRAEGFGGPAPEDDEAVESRLKARIGAPYVRAMQAIWTQSADFPRLVRETIEDLTAILREADGADAPRRALCLLAADAVVNKLSGGLVELSANGAHESAAAPGVRRQLAPYGVKLGGMTHDGGLAYERELLWRVWREWPETEAGELAFLELQRVGWNTGSGEGCPKNPDLFREVIAKAE